MMFNTVVPIKNKLELVHKFFTEVWKTDLIKDDRPSPPTVEQMDNMIHESTFPVLKLLELEDWWHKARMFYYMGGDESMLRMEGDVTREDQEEYLKKFFQSEEEDAQLEKRMAAGDEEAYQRYETKHGMGHMVRFPFPVRKVYDGNFVRYSEGIMTFKLADDSLKDFNLSTKDLMGVNLSRPLRVHTLAFRTQGQKEEDVEDKYFKVEKIEQIEI